MPDKNVQLPDGRVVAFPDSMADADINSAIQKELGPPKASPPPTYLQKVWGNLNKQLPKGAGGDAEIQSEGAVPAMEGMTTLGAIAAPVEAIATRSLAPLLPVARAILGSVAGKYAGREVGGLVGQPQLGGQIGAVAGGLYGGAGGKIPNKADLMALFEKGEAFKEGGGVLPSAEEFYANKGKEIMAAMKQQPEAFGLPKINDLGGPLPSTDKFYEMRGREIMAAMRQQPEAFGMSKESGALQPTKSRIQSPESAPPVEQKITYQSVKGPDLLKKVMSGDMDAIVEWQRRGLPLPANVKYMVEQGQRTQPWRNLEK